MTPEIDLPRAQRFYAEELRAVAGLQSNALVDAFATVRRDSFLGPGPWLIPSIDMFDPRGGGYRETPDADPRQVHHNIAVALDRSRQLNNGHPATLATWIEWVGIARGDRVLHIGCGTGYYTAIMAELAGADGVVVAIEADAALASRAVENLRPWPHVLADSGDGTGVEGPFDVIFVNAGVTHPLPQWLDALRRDGGRMLLPVTVAFGTLGKGAVVRIERSGDSFAARAGGLVMIYSCTVARDESRAGAIGQALGSNAFSRVRRLRRDPHPAAPACIVHYDGGCLCGK